MPLKRFKISPSELEKSRQTSKNQVKKQIFGVFLVHTHTAAAQEVILLSSHSSTINGLYSLASGLPDSLHSHQMTSLPQLKLFPYIKLMRILLFKPEYWNPHFFCIQNLLHFETRGKFLNLICPGIHQDNSHKARESQWTFRQLSLSQSLAEQFSTKHWRENVSTPTLLQGSSISKMPYR